MSETPVLVVHGVANRDQHAFELEVAGLQARLNRNYRLIPVWWADLGGKTANLADTLPAMGSPQVRADLNQAELARDLTALRASIASQSPEFQVRSGESKEDIIVRAARAQFGVVEEVRGLDDVELRDAIHQGWENSTYLPLIRDQRALEAIGRAVAVASGAVDQSEEPFSGFVTRGPSEKPFAETIETRGIKDKFGNAARAVMAEIDKVVGYAVGQVAGDLNQSLRASWAEQIGLFLGDILAYQRRQAEVQNRLMDAINQNAAGWGTKEKPISVAAHSLGGVIAFDAATRAQSPLWISGFITFGSQSSFFEVLDPRPGLQTYSPGNPIVLPPTIARWMSLWEPIDVLAFAVGKVFKLNSGQMPIDVRTVHDLKSGLQTHGSYWHAPELVDAIQQMVSD